MNIQLFWETYKGLIILGSLIVGVIIVIYYKKKKEGGNKKMETPNNIKPQFSPIQNGIDEIEQIMGSPKNMGVATKNIFELLKEKREILSEEIEKKKQISLQELQKVKMTKEETYKLLQQLIIYYKDLEKKEKLLTIEMSGLVQ